MLSAVRAQTEVENTICSYQGKLVIGYGEDVSHIRDLLIVSRTSRIKYCGISESIFDLRNWVRVMKRVGELTLRALGAQFQCVLANHELPRKDVARSMA